MTRDQPNAAAHARPALVLAGGAPTHLRVAALPVLDRLLVTLHRVGCHPITVVATEPLPPLPRATAWRIPFVTVPQPPPRTTPTVVIRADTLTDLGDARALASAGDPIRLIAADGSPLPAGLAGPGESNPIEALDGLSERRATPVTCRVRDHAEARRATRALWASITSSSDGQVDRHFNRPVGRPLSRLLVHTPVTPNAISLGSTLIGVLAAAMFAVGEHGWAVAAAIVFQISAIIDCVDGDVARAVFKETPLGKWLDLVGDQVVHIAVFAGIAIGLARGGMGGVAGWLGLSAAAGAVLSFLVVLRGWRQIRRRGDEGGRMQRLLDAMTNRDFSVLVLALALADRLEWFLWLAATGSHLFWIGLLVLQLRSTGTPREGR